MLEMQKQGENIRACPDHGFLSMIIGRLNLIESSRCRERECWSSMVRKILPQIRTDPSAERERGLGSATLPSATTFY